MNDHLVSTLDSALPAEAGSATAPVRSVAVSLPAAALVGVGVLACGTGGPLPVIGAAAFLFLVVEQDLRRLRIPNWLTLPALAAALAWHGLAGAGLGFALAGAGLALALLLPPWLAGLLGGGDVKASVALGALLGLHDTTALLIWAALLGGAVGLPLLAWRRGLGDLLRRWRDSLLLSLSTRRPVYLAPAPDAPAARVLPFGLFLGLATAATLAWGAAWA